MCVWVVACLLERLVGCFVCLLCMPDCVFDVLIRSLFCSSLACRFVCLFDRVFWLCVYLFVRFVGWLCVCFCVFDCSCNCSCVFVCGCLCVWLIVCLRVCLRLFGRVCWFGCVGLLVCLCSACLPVSLVVCVFMCLSALLFVFV